MEWNSDRTLSFVEDYRKHSVLWDTAHQNYKNREARRDSLLELGSEYSMDTKSVLNKIKSLRSYFHREHAKVLKKKQTGLSADDKYPSNWFAYKHLLFILEGGEETNANDAIQDDNMITEEDNEYITPDTEKLTEVLIPKQEIVADFVEHPIVPVKKRKKIDPPIEAPSKSTHRNQTGHFDHFSLFGEYVASRVRRLTHHRLQSIAQHRINNVLFELEMDPQVNAPFEAFSNHHQTIPFLPYSNSQMDLERSRSAESPTSRPHTPYSDSVSITQGS